MWPFKTNESSIEEKAAEILEVVRTTPGISKDTRREFYSLLASHLQEEEELLQTSFTIIEADSSIFRRMVITILEQVSTGVRMTSASLLQQFMNSFTDEMDNTADYALSGDEGDAVVEMIDSLGSGEENPEEMIGQSEEILRKIKKGGKSKRVKTIRNDQPKIGRNDPCPCGSGGKYKKCCMNKPDSE